MSAPPVSSPWIPAPQALSAPIRENASETSRRTLLFFLMSAWVFFLPLQFQGARMNLAPSDFLLGLALALGLGRLRLVAGAGGPLSPGFFPGFRVVGCPFIA